MRRTLPLLLGCAWLLSGCDGDVGSAQTSAGTGGASTATTGTGGSGGAGGSGDGGGLLTSSSSSGSFPPVCDDPTVFVDVEGDGPLQHHDASCAPEGHLIGGGGPGAPPPPEPPDPTGGLLHINACSSPYIVLFLSASSNTWPGMAGTFARYDHAGVEYDALPGATIDVTAFGAVGGVIEGTFAGKVAKTDPNGAGPAEIALSGAFRVCRGPDVVLP